MPEGDKCRIIQGGRNNPHTIRDRLAHVVGASEWVVGASETVVGAFQTILGAFGTLVGAGQFVEWRARKVT